MTLPLAHPLAGPWRALNSPGSRVPSHGTTRFALSHAIDLVPVDGDGRSGPVRLTTWVMPEPPDRFVGFGRPVLAPAAGAVVVAHDGEDDHVAHRGLPSVVYTLSQGRRLARGFAAVAGNHLILRVGEATYVALCHLRRGSITVDVGDTVAVGQAIAECGNSGNSTEPHVHLQAMTDPDPRRATALPITFPGGLPRNGQVVGG